MFQKEYRISVVTARYNPGRI